MYDYRGLAECGIDVRSQLIERLDRAERRVQELEAELKEMAHWLGVEADVVNMYVPSYYEVKQERDAYRAALNEVCTDLACDDQCPDGCADFEEWPECANCPGKIGEIHQNTERDISCWERYYLGRALAALEGVSAGER